MDPDDRIDEALRAVARAEASRDFAARVRAQIDAPDTVPSRWPRVAMACAAVVLVAASAIWLLRSPAVAPAPTVTTARATPAEADSVAAPAPRLDPTPLVASVHRPTARLVRAATIPRAVPHNVATDHERALAPLASIDALDAGSIAPTPLVMANEPIAALPPIAPLDVANDLGGSDR
jgi:hypothetical protein